MAAGILYSRCFFVFFIVIKKTPRIQYLLLASITGAFFFFKIKKNPTSNYEKPSAADGYSVMKCLISFFL